MPGMSNSPAPRPPRTAPEPAVVVLRAYDLAQWVIRRSETFPRSHRYHLGDRVVRRALDILDGLSAAVWTNHKHALLQQAMADINSLRLLLRLACDLDLLPGTSHEFAARSLDEIGRMTGGWLKAVQPGMPESGRAARVVRGPQK